MKPSVACALLLTAIVPVVKSNAVVRQNNNARPITWVSAEGNQRCWQVDNGNIRANEILVV